MPGSSSWSLAEQPWPAVVDELGEEEAKERPALMVSRVAILKNLLLAAVP